MYTRSALVHLCDKQRKQVTSDSYVKDGSFVVQGKAYSIINMCSSFPRVTYYSYLLKYTL